ncbi:BTB/POZ domain-containing adapter for CUL3-mediated RhoA degradation protein 3-like isoform X2 [Panonychus citri]|uniref:BTB/POZ domain-containing adapter for CUL3-mediated RhoA degradation protein 3-like isoform X2 n=1 Tax=Panonychus citri TaxID=50023 RepID=UPI0023072760|nr:BTB/POZ domain-containing adapter for CUL3-mediated RhoA degradation protein 3-like isoform X2 [Panonychus citri]
MSESGESCESELSAEAVTLVQNRKSQFVKLNVGGFLFQTTIATLTKVDCMFRGMFSGGFEVQKDPEGWILINRNGKHFETILEYFRNMKVTLPDNVEEIRELLTEAIYYSIVELISHCEHQLKRSIKRDKIALTTSVEKVEEIEASGNARYFKPTVRLTIIQPKTLPDIYTNLSIENLCKNYQLFDNLCFNSNGRIDFIKSISKTQPVCTWSFFKNSGIHREVFCVRIVNGSPHVDFLEGKIYDNTLELLVDN